MILSIAYIREIIIVVIIIKAQENSSNINDRNIKEE